MPAAVDHETPVLFDVVGTTLAYRIPFRHECGAEQAVMVDAVFGTVVATYHLEGCRYVVDEGDFWERPPPGP